MNVTIVNIHRLRAILERYPTLSGEGLGLPNLPASDSSDGGIDLERVCEAMKWIASRCERTETIRHELTSYGLKHAMEEETDTYVSNGEFILAALLCGFDPDDANELNPFFNLKVLPGSPT